MATTKFYLDTRRKNEASHVLRINICQRSKTAAYPLGIKLTTKQWDPANKAVINHPEAKYWTNFVQRKKIEIETLIMKLEDSDPKKAASMTAIEIRDYVTRALNPIEEAEPPKPKKPKVDKTTVKYWYDKWMELKTGGTRELYEVTRKRLVTYCKGEEGFGNLRFEDITKDWLLGLVEQMSKTAKSANTRGIALRNLRTVCNYAIDNDITTYYPFRRFKIENAKTRKRNFDVYTLRKIILHKCEEEWQEKYLDYFILTFMFIGINSADLFNLDKVRLGRIEYIRAKTHKPYSVKVEPEAKFILDKYKGTKKLLDFCEGYVRHKHFFNNLSKGLNSIKSQFGLDELTTYWARHSWATIARKLGISKDTIGLALGHSQKTVTDIYIEYDPDEIDIANRKVLDWVLWGKINGKVVEKPGSPEFFGEKKEAKKRGRPKKDATQK